MLRALQGPGIGGAGGMSLKPNPVAGTSGIEDREQRGVDLLGRNPIRTQVLKFSTDPKEKLEKVTRRQLEMVGNTTLHSPLLESGPKMHQELQSQNGPAWEGLLSDHPQVKSTLCAEGWETIMSAPHLNLTTWGGGRGRI